MRRTVENKAVTDKSFHCRHERHELASGKRGNRCWGLAREHRSWGPMVPCPCDCHIVAERAATARGETYRR